MRKYLLMQCALAPFKEKDEQLFFGLSDWPHGTECVCTVLEDTHTIGAESAACHRSVY